MGSRPIVDETELYHLHSYCHPRFECLPHHVKQAYTVVCIQQFFHCQLHSESVVIQSVCFRSASWTACYLELFPSLGTYPFSSLDLRVQCTTFSFSLLI